jgi:hypothetical protein
VVDTATDSRTGFTDDGMGDHPADTLVSGYEYGSVTRGLAAYYPFEGDATDAVGTYDADLTLSGATFAGAGQVGSDSLALDGVDDYASAAAAPWQSPPQLTVAAWIYPTGFTDTYSRVVAHDGSTQAYQLLVANQSKAGFRVWTTNTTAAGVLGFGPDIPTGQWTHLAGTYDGSQVVGYVNGDPYELDTASGSVQDGTGPFTIGRRSDTTQEHWQGQIDDVRVYDRALGSGEITHLASLTSPSTVTMEDRLR